MSFAFDQLLSINDAPAIHWNAFLDSNNLEPEERNRIAADLRKTGKSHIGGGASPEFTLRAVSREEFARSMLGKRIEIPVHYDLWMRGARFGKVTAIGKDGAFVYVRLDHPQVTRRLKLWRIDFEYAKLV